MTSHSPYAPPAAGRPGQVQHWGPLPHTADALAMAQAAQAHEGLTLVITDNSRQADQLSEALKFFLAEQALPILALPDWEILPYDSFSPHQDIVSQRIHTLYHLPQTQQGILIVPVSTLLHRLAPQSFLSGRSLMVKVGQRLDTTAFRQQLLNAGYTHTDTVYEHGEFALRGSIVDLFPMGSQMPYRIDLFDEDIDSIRSFDPETQKSLEQLEAVELLPAHEFPFDDSAIQGFRARWREQFEGNPRDCAVYNDVSDGIASPGIEYYLPLFFDDTATLFDYLPDNTLIFSSPQLEAASEHFSEDVQRRYEDRRHDRLRPLLPPQRLFLANNELFQQLKSFHRIIWHEQAVSNKPGLAAFSAELLPDIAIDSKLSNPLQRFATWLDSASRRVLLCAESAGRREVLLDILQQHGIRPKPVANWHQFVASDSLLGITIAPLEAGLQIADPAISLVAEPQLFGRQVLQSRRRQARHDAVENVVKNLTELRLGAPVIHIDHGVGRYRGLQTIELDGQKTEFVTIEYAAEAKLYVPVADLHLIARYTGADDELAPLHRLGTEKWTAAKRKAAEKIRDTAAELLDIYARREARPGYAFTLPKEDYEAFAAGFPFEETPDQQSAIQAVLHDMTQPKSMDRLICGDVGFGKTEVAMRAAFIAAHNGYQVAVLVPTTLLAQQHYNSFKDRFADTPIQVEVLSRFRSQQSMDAVNQKLRDGKVDIVVGTHKLLGSDIQFNNLGLMIIDEEHRFGVKQKEKMKAMRADVDILTLTATPIPRTLNMSMSGMRDLSIIATPPEKRLSVKTFVRQRDTALIKEAMLREILRGGQVYFLHNEVKTIEKSAREISELIPEARVAVAHGQMRERQLEQIMADFYHKRFNVLVCSTIIETGIDVPSANTIIMERADKLGLAQLHQLRGRVGRSHHQAYAYLLTPDPKSMTSDAVKRLEAIAASQDLGAGFMLATHDLEIRGAGELLGEEQHGQIQSIGFSLYMDMLDRAVKAIKAGKTPNLDRPLDSGAEVDLKIPALIPDDYLPDVHNRLIMYKRIANADSDDALKELQVEMIDRFGMLTPEIKNLFRQMTLKLKAQRLGVAKISASAHGGQLEFADDTEVDPLKIVTLVQQQPQQYQLAGPNQLKFSWQTESADARLTAVDELLGALAA